MQEKDFCFERQEGFVRIKAKGKTEAEVLSRLVNGLASCQLSPGEVLVGGGGQKEIKLGYSKKKYLPSDLINDILGLQAVSGQIYPEVASLSLADGILKAELVGAKKKPSLDLKEALYLNSVFKKDNEGFLVEVDVIF
jgi:hypothetical protein